MGNCDQGPIPYQGVGARILTARDNLWLDNQSCELGRVCRPPVPAKSRSDPGARRMSRMRRVSAVRASTAQSGRASERAESVPDQLPS